MDGLASLELLSLVSKVTSELRNHLGINDKTLAEFVIAQHSKCRSLPEFKAQLEAMGAEFPQSLVESIDRLILTMHPKHKGKAKEGTTETNKPEDTAVLDDFEKKTRKFKGLAVPDKEQQWEDEPQLNALDHDISMLEDLAKQSRNSTNGKKRSRSPDDVDGGFGRPKKDRRRSRSRSYSPERRGRHRKHHDQTYKDVHGRPTDHRRAANGDHIDGADANMKRRAEGDDHYFKRRPTLEIDEAPKIFKIYDGTVTNLQSFGAFVNLYGVKGKVDGLVHVSAMQQGARVNDPSDLVSRGQHVKVKVTSIENNSGPRGPKIGLSMKEVDQVTGRDIVPQKRLASGANMERLDGMGPVLDSNDQPITSDSEPLIPRGGTGGGRRGQKKRMTSPERWEIQQLIASGAISALDYPDLNEEYNATLAGERGFEEEEDVDIEVREDEPPFLAGQTKQSLELSPIRVVKAPDGSMNRAAMAGTSLAKERRDLRQQEAKDKAAEQASQVDLNAQWQDPMMASDQRKFASDLRNPQAPKAPEAPEWKRVTQSKNQSLGKRTSMSIKEQRESLPVFKFRKQLLDAINDNQLLIVVGETGSGKTTQLSQYLAEGGYASLGTIGCTQPRRVAAVSVAKRVAEEVGCRLGQEVGYTIRFEDCTSPETKIKYMTDGILQREILLDPTLKNYSVVILDEAHERTLATDVLFGLLKKTLSRRPDLKVIVTSATLDADKFSEYFNKCPIFTIPGRTFPVEILYSREPETDYLDAALVTVMQIHLTEDVPGDILLFLTGQEEIDTSCEILYERMKALGPNVRELIILPIYSALPSEMQSKIFEPAPRDSRKVVIATNIAETSITIDGILYVVDPGYVKQNAYDAKLGMDSLIPTPISQAQAKQRAGRAGRTGPGKCFRLYTEAAFQSEMLPTSIPEIQRRNMCNTILMLKAMGINDLIHFDFMDPPPTNTLLSALEELYALSALDDEGLLTRLGRKMAEIPEDPGLAKVLIYSVDKGCSEEILSIVAMLAVQSVFYRPKEKQQQADQKKAKFNDPNGDHLTLLNVYNGWKHSKFSTPWCFENFIQARAMKRAQDIRQQLVSIMERHKHRISSCGRDTALVRKTLCSGFFRNACRKDPQEGYKTLIGKISFTHLSNAMLTLKIYYRGYTRLHASIKLSIRKACRACNLPHLGPDNEGIHALHLCYRPEVACGSSTHFF